MSEPPDEFEWIDRLRPLTRGDRRALDLRDDAAVLVSRPGFELVISTDAMVEGVHVLAGEAPEIIARRLLRVSLSDLAAKAAEPFGYLLTTAWPRDRGWPDRQAFISGLSRDGEAFGVALLGGDTISTTGPLTVSATVFGWAPSGRTILRSAARAGDVLMVCGAIGDGWLGLKAARGEIDDPDGRLAARYRLPSPLLGLRDALRSRARAAADVSDGLLADAGHIAEASGLSAAVDIDRMPLSAEAAAWLAGEADHTAARLALATGGDDYAIVCAVDQADAAVFAAEVAALGVLVASIGVFSKGGGVTATAGRTALPIARSGWRH